MPIRIQIRNGDLPIAEGTLRHGLTLGRDPACDLVLDDPLISRKHARIVEKGGSFFFDDLESANGTYVGGEQVPRVELTVGTEIEIPPYLILIVDSENADDADDSLYYQPGISPSFDSDGEPIDDPSQTLVEEPESLGNLLEQKRVERQTVPAFSDIDGEETERNADFLSSEPHQADTRRDGDQLQPPLSTEQPLVGNSTILVPFKAAGRLYPLNLNLAEEFVELGPDMITLGRAPACQVVLPHLSVSNQHAMIKRDGDNYVLQDMKSTNGVRVNGDVINDCLLHCHDVIEIGDVKLEFLEGAAMPMARSHNVIEVADNDNLDGITERPPRFQLSRRLKTANLTLLVIAAVLLLIPLLRSNGINKGPYQKSIVLNQKTGQEKPLEELERDRIIRYQMHQARALVQRGNYQEAAVKVDLILEKLAPQNLEARTMREEIRRMMTIHSKKEEKRIVQAQHRVAKVQNLIIRAGHAQDSGDFAVAKSLYRKVLAVDPGHKVAREGIDRVNQMVDEQGHKQTEKQKLYEKLREDFTRGMLAYNSNDHTQAARFLRKVTAHPNAPNYSQARIALDDIEEKLLIEVEEKLSDAKDLYHSGHLVDARKLLREILEGNPKHEAALSLQTEVLHEARDKARGLYREAYVFEKQVEDFASAKERYVKVLELLPESNEEYHKKAKTRLNQLR